MLDGSGRQVHFGAGALGLGLIVARTAGRVAISLVHGVSAGATEIGTQLNGNGGYRLLMRAAEGGILTREITLSPGSETIALTREDRWRARITDPGTALVTTAVGERELELLAPALRDALTERTRVPGPPLAVIACENRVGPAFRALAEKFAGTAVTFVPSVVDRICRRPEIRVRRVEVLTETYGSWLLQDVPAARRVQALLPGVCELAAEIGVLYRRKRWLVNTPHFVVALHARRHGVRSVDEFVLGAGAHVLAQVQDECLGALLASFDGLDVGELRAFNRTVACRFAAVPVATGTVLRRLRPQNRASLPGTVDDLLIQPRTAYLRAYGHMPQALTRATRLLAHEEPEN